MAQLGSNPTSEQRVDDLEKLTAALQARIDALSAVIGHLLTAKTSDWSAVVEAATKASERPFYSGRAASMNSREDQHREAQSIVAQVRRFASGAE